MGKKSGQAHSNHSDYNTEKPAKVKPPYWKDLDELYDSNARMLVGISRDLQDALSIPGVAKAVPNVTELNIAIKAFNKDCNGFIDELTAINQEHADRKGRVKEDDYVDYLELGGKYQQFTLKMGALTAPFIQLVGEQVDVGIQRLTSQQTTNEKPYE